jgi:hypothetical protein
MLEVQRSMLDIPKPSYNLEHLYNQGFIYGVPVLRLKETGWVETAVR